MKKFVFISLPMNGREDKDIGNRLKEINKTVKEKASAKFGWDISEIYTIDNFWDCCRFKTHLNGNRNLLYLGEAISNMDAADAIYFDEGWEHARGCMVENMAAKLYNVPVIYYNEGDNDITGTRELTPNEVRSIIGYKPVEDPKATVLTGGEKSGEG